MKKYDNQEGRSMIEMLGVLAIVGVLSVAGIAGYSKAMGKFKVSKVMDQVSTISANVKTMYANVGSYSNLDTATAYNLGLIPEEMTKSCTSATCSPTHGFNGTTTIAGTSGNFSITMTAIPKDACIALGTSEWGGSSGFEGLKNGSDSVLGFEAAASKCADGATLTWTFR